MVSVNYALTIGLRFNYSKGKQAGLSCTARIPSERASGYMGARFLPERSPAKSFSFILAVDRDLLVVLHRIPSSAPL